MSAASNITDVIRTSLIGGTVAFLGYLGYDLMQSRFNNPAPQVVTLDSKELEAVRDELTLLRAETSELQAQYRDLAKPHASTLQPNPAQQLGLRANTRIEYGTVPLKVGKGTNKATIHIDFQNAYKGTPTVVCTDNGTRGTFAYVRVSSVTSSGCYLGVLKAGDWVDNFTTPIGYMVIGQVE